MLFFRQKKNSHTNRGGALIFNTCVISQLCYRAHFLFSYLLRKELIDSWQKISPKKRKEEIQFSLFFLYSTTFHCETNETLKYFVYKRCCHIHTDTFCGFYTHIDECFRFYFLRDAREFTAHTKAESVGEGEAHTSF